MRLRSGFIYTCNIKYVKRKSSSIKINVGVKINESINTTCVICMMEYKKGDKITSCSRENIKKHNFHSECMKTHIKTSAKMSGNNLGPFHCPYCMVKLNKFEIYTAKKNDLLNT